MTRITQRTFETDTEVAEVAKQAQRLYALADMLVARAERLRESAETLVSAAHVEVHLWSTSPPSLF